MPFVKLDCKILYSSIWAETPETKTVWITMLALADQNGIVPATAPGISIAAVVSLEDTRKALAIFESPDPDSKSLENKGRRVERVEGGYKVLNYESYRSFNYSMNPEAIKKRKQREKLNIGDIEGDIVPPMSGHSASASASEYESKTIKLRDKIKNKIADFKKVWLEQIQFYMTKYPGLDYNLECEKIEAWMDENPRKALKRKNMNLFIQSWLGRVRPRYGFKNQAVPKVPADAWEKEHYYDDYMSVENNGLPEIEKMIAVYMERGDKLNTASLKLLNEWQAQVIEAKGIK
jgi:hypothetical protein